MSTQLPPGQKLCTCSHTCGINGVPRPERTYFHHQAKAKKLLIQARAAQVSSLTNDTTPSSPIPSGHRYTQGHGKSGSESDSDSSDSSESSSGHYSDSRVDSPMDQDGPGMQSVHDPHGDMNNSQSPDFGGESNSDSGMNYSPTRPSPPLLARSPAINDMLLDSDSPHRSDESDSSSDSSSDSDSTSESGAQPTSPKEFIIANKFIAGLQNAYLNNPEELDRDIIQRLQNPPEYTPELDRDERLSIDLFLSVSNASEETYNSARAAIMRRHPEDEILSHFRVKKLVEEISGVSSIVRDMCVNSCIAYTGPYTNLECCPHDGEPRYDQKRFERTGAKVPRKQFHTIPIGPQLQAMHRSQESAEQLKYRKECTDKILAELAANDNVHVSAYKDFFDGTDYLEAVLNEKIKAGDMVLMLSIDGAQLYRNKVSDCWMYIWIIFDRPPSMRYKKRYILPGGFFPGPNKPKNSDSFLYPGLYHLSALQREGLRIWSCLSKSVFISKPFLALATADGPGMASINGCVGHHGKRLCRIYCEMTGRRKSGSSTYYPARFVPDNYHVAGSDHPDIELGPLLDSYDSADAAKRYETNLMEVAGSLSRKQYAERRLETGISKPTIFSGLPPDHILGIPDIFGLDNMHVPILNLTDLTMPLLRGLFECDKEDNKEDWDWAVLTGETWKLHGRAVADLAKYIPGSFDNPPRNPAEKINSGYKAWEFLLYYFGLGPALFYGILPEKYYTNYCKSVRAIRILLQEEALPEEVMEAHLLLTDFSDTFEDIYVQRRADRLHFVRPVIHTLSHMPGETIRKGPGNLYSQWALERTIGNLGEEIKQHSNPYENLAQRGIRRAQVNALKAIIPDLEPEPSLPRGSVDLGDGYVLLRAMDNCSREVSDSEDQAIRRYMSQHCDPDDSEAEDIVEEWRPSVVRWARVRLPNGQITRSAWKELQKSDLRTARMVKITSSVEHGDSDSDEDQAKKSEPEFAEVHFYMILDIQGVHHHIAVGSFFGPPDPHLLQISSQTYWSVQHQRESDVRAFKIKQIESCVMMGPDAQYRHYRDDDSAEDRWFLMEKPGLKLAQMTEYTEDINEND